VDVIAIVKMTVTAVLDQFYAPSVLTVCNEALAPATTAPEAHPMRFSRTRRPFVRHSHVMANARDVGQLSAKSPTSIARSRIRAGRPKRGRNARPIVGPGSESRHLFVRRVQF